eukprot:1858355-Pyramimonas_sp.AAC.1
MPSRALPILGIGSNGHIGLVRAPAGYTSTDDSCTGPFNRSLQQPRTQQFIDFLLKYDLILLNTFYNTFPTY